MIELSTVEDLYEEFYFNIQHREVNSFTGHLPINEHQTKFWVKLDLLGNCQPMPSLTQR